MKELRAWCCRQLATPDTEQVALTAVAGDASFRRYFRLSDSDGQRYIVMDAPPAKEDSRPFVDIAARLRRSGIHAPEVLAADLERGWLLLEDLGDELLRESLQQRDATRVMAQAFGVLERLPAVDAGGLPAFDAVLLQHELDLFPHWYLARHRARPFDTTELRRWLRLCDTLIASAAEQPQVFVHRDFHSCNLMYLGEQPPGVIDFQDAVCGPISYDLVSILLDRYISWPREQLEQWMEDFRRRLAIDVDAETWRRWCDWMGLQRNLKILGIFARLAYRDEKRSYLELTPRFADYVRDVLQRYDQLADYRALLESRL